MENRLPRIQSVISSLENGIYDKQIEISLSLLAALSGESILLLGPPGVAKSMVARRLKTAFRGARSFEYLMSRFSTPDEIFGPVSIARLKADDKYERATSGFLPEADIVFLDEIWKAGPAIQNTLLTVINEKLFRNGDREQHLPLKLLVAASNELPAKGEGLEALWDRFLVRIICRNISDENVFRQMLCDDEQAEMPDESVQIGAEEYAEWQRQARRLPLSSAVLDTITAIRTRLQKVEVEGHELPRTVYVSDRRWKHIVSLIRTSAFLQDREAVSPADVWVTHHCLWNEPDEREAVRNIVLTSLFAPALERLQTLAAEVRDALHTLDARSALVRAVRNNDHRDDHLFIANGCFYQLENHGTGHTYVFITDFKALPAYSRVKPQTPGLVFDDPEQRGRKIVCIDRGAKSVIKPPKNVEHVTLARDDERIYINGVGYKMRAEDRASFSPASGTIDLFSSHNETAEEQNSTLFASARFEDRIEEICNEIEGLHHALLDNLFVQEAERTLISERVSGMYKSVALCRADISRLLYGAEN